MLAGMIHSNSLTPRTYRCMYADMNKEEQALRRITANLPRGLLAEACRSTGKGITETLVEGLTMIRRSRAASKARRLKGRLHLDVDLELSRERARR